MSDRKTGSEIGACGPEKDFWNTSDLFACNASLVISDEKEIVRVCQVNNCGFGDDVCQRFRANVNANSNGDWLNEVRTYIAG